MDPFSESMAWLAMRDGSVVIGRGPFRESAEAPAAGIAFFVGNFPLNDPKPWKIPASVERTTTREIAARFRPPPLSCEWEPLDAVPFSVVFQEIMGCIGSGLFEKNVPVVTENGTAGCDPARAIMGAMIRQTQPLYSYGWIQDGAGFSGATPELLLSLQGNHLETMALAGTARSDDCAAFAVDEKEIREHEYVAQSMVSKLHDLGHIDRSAREILNLGSIVHFLTHFKQDLRTLPSAEELIKKFHPTPALGPLPRTNETLGLLLEWRQRLGCPLQFGAPFGLWDQGKFDAIVAIRGIWWKNNRLMLPAGCGVIEASRLVNEWRELRLKREAVKRFLIYS